MKLLFLLLIPLLISGSPDASKIDKVNKYLEASKEKAEHAIFIDMSIPSNEKRLFLVQLDNKNVIYSTYVAHGKGSGRGSKATHFSDDPGSYCTALGIYKVGKNYTGKHGDSFELIGLEKSNANALKRAIVIHPAWYVAEDFILKQGRCGNSWGCPAVSDEAFKKLRPYFLKKIIVYIYN